MPEVEDSVGERVSASSSLSDAGPSTASAASTDAGSSNLDRNAAASSSSSSAAKTNGQQRSPNGNSRHDSNSYDSGGSSSSPERRPTSRRVKVYKLRDDTWDDLGTGACSCHVVDPASGSNSPDTDGLDEGAWIIVRNELSPPQEDSNNSSEQHSHSQQQAGEFLLRTRIVPGALWSDDDDDEHDPDKEIGGYQKQQDTLIVWTERDTGVDMALSFATAQGCGEVWEFIKVTKKWHDNVATSPSLSPSLSSPQSLPLYSLSIPQLPNPSLSNLEQLERTIRSMSRTAVGRERTASAIIKNETIQKLIALQEEAEDLESLDDLHALCRLTQFILCLNDTSIFELILRDDIILGVASILEYDPEFPTMKASYRSHLADPSHFVQVVPIRSPQLLAKIHQTHRLHYLKDVVMARILEDSTFSMLNSAIYFNEVDIVNDVSTDPNLLREIFALFDVDRNGESTEAPGKNPLKRNDTFIGPSQESTSPTTPAASLPAAAAAAGSDKQQDAIFFLQQLCQMAKALQLTTRAAFFRSLADRGLLRVIEVALARATVQNGSAMRSATVEILTALVDHDANSVRGYSLRQHGKNKSLVIFLIELFHQEEDLGLKAQMCEALRILVDAGGESAPQEAPARIRQEDPEAEKFLQYFYDHCVQLLAEPILSLPEPGPVALNSQQIALCAHLCDLFCFFVQFHTFRSKYFVLSSQVSQHVAKLLRPRHKHLRLSALRYFRVVIGKQDEFYNRDLMRFRLFGPILDVMYEERHKDNLLASATLEFFEAIVAENSKQVIRHLVEEHGERVRALAAEQHAAAASSLLVSADSPAAKLAPLPTFEKLVSKYEQMAESAAAAASSTTHESAEMRSSSGVNSAPAVGPSSPTTASSATLAGPSPPSNSSDGLPEANASSLSQEAHGGVPAADAGWIQAKAEESYFDGSDDDEEVPAAGAEVTTSKKRDMDEQDSVERSKRQRTTEVASSASEDAAPGGFIRETSPAASNLDPQEQQEPPEHVFKVGEMMKKKRELEDDEDEFGMMGAKLRKTTTTSGASSEAIAAVAPATTTASSTPSTTTNGTKGPVKITIGSKTLGSQANSITVKVTSTPESNHNDDNKKDEGA